MLCQCGCSGLELAGVARPAAVRVAAFFDGQNLTNSARRCFDEQMPTFDPRRLAEDAIKRSPILSNLPAQLVSVNFYTGVHKASWDPFWSRFWQIKLARFGLGGSPQVEHRSTTRPLAYSDGVAREKGIDVRIALDVLSFASEGQYDAAIIFSQDKDLSEAVTDVRAFASKHRRWVHLETAFLWTTATNSQYGEKLDKHGLPNTCWTKIHEAGYRACAETEDVAAAAGNSLLSAGPGPNFVMDLLDAFHHFTRRNGYLGVNYFVEKWRFHRCPNEESNWYRSMMTAVCAVGLARKRRHPHGDWELVVDTKHILIPAVHRTVP
jgi:uncharacterized LabA/DUF88 family protein